MSTDPRCPNFIHDAIVATAVSFSRGTRFVAASGDDRLITGQCSKCGETLTYPLHEWSDNTPTEPMRGRSVSRTTTEAP